MSRLLIRTEASEQTGMGHFMRCYAIAEEALARGKAVNVLVSHYDAGVARRCGDRMALDVVGDFGQDIPAIQRIVQPSDWLLIDSYRADADYIAELHRSARVAVMDDLDALERFDCDLLINPAMAAPEASYRQKTTARLLLGPDYALIRREFREPPGPPVMTGPSIAVMFGGSDPTGLTAQVARQLHNAVPGATVKVIAGPANSRVAELQALAEDLPSLRLFISPPHMGPVLGGSDLVVTAAGGSVGEVAAMGLAALVLVVYDNQKAALEACPFPVIDARDGLPDDLTRRVVALMNDVDERKRIARAGHAVVDGKGAQRVVEAMSMRTQFGV